VIRSRAGESLPLPLPKRRVELSFEVEHLDLNRLLEPWRWPCAQRVTLVARNGFGDLFFRTVEGKVLRLNVGERDGLVQPPFRTINSFIINYLIGSAYLSSGVA
jgi:hypothetical protein